MARELNDAEYAAMLAGGNVTVAWHSIAGKDWNFDTVNAAMERAVYNALCQVFSERLNIELPAEMPEK